MSEENLEQAPLKDELSFYEPIEAGLAELESKHKDVVVDVTTKEGKALAIRGRGELRDVRLNIEEARTNAKKEVLERGRRIDETAKKLTARIQPLELAYDNALKAQKKIEDDAKAAEEAEAKRIKDEEEAKVKREEQARILAEREKNRLEAERLEKEKAEMNRKREQQEQEERQRKLDLEAEEKRRLDKIAEEDRQRKLQHEKEDRERREKIEAEQRAARAEQDKIDAEIKRKKDEQFLLEKNQREAKEKADREAREKEAEEARKKKVLAEEKALIKTRQLEAKAFKKKQDEELKSNGYKALNFFVETYNDAPFTSINLAIKGWLSEFPEVKDV